MTDRADLIIKTNQEHGEADLDFLAVTEERLVQLHGEVIGEVDGVSGKRPVQDFVVAIRKRDFPEVIQRLEAWYKVKGLTVEIEDYGTDSAAGR